MEFGPLCQSLTPSRHVSGSSGWDFFLQFFHSVTRFFCLPLPSELELIDLMLGMFHPCTSVALSSDIPASVFWTSSQAANSMEANEISISTLSRPWVKLSYFSCKSFTVFFTFTWCQSRQISISQSYKATKQQSQPPQWHLSQFIFSCLKWKTHVLKSKKSKEHFFQKALQRNLALEIFLCLLYLRCFNAFLAQDKWTSAAHVERCQTKWISSISFQLGWCALQTQYPCVSLLVEIRCFTQLRISMYITCLQSPAALLFTISNFFCRSATYDQTRALLSVGHAPVKQLS